MEQEAQVRERIEPGAPQWDLVHPQAPRLERHTQGRTWGQIGRGHVHPQALRLERREQVASESEQRVGEACNQ